MRTAEQIAASIARAIELSRPLCVLLPNYDYVQMATMQPPPVVPLSICGVPLVRANGLLRTFAVCIDHTGQPKLQEIP